MAKLTVNETLSQGPSVPPPGPSHPLRRTPQTLHPFWLRSQLRRIQRGRGEDAPSCTRQNQRHQGAHLVWRPHLLPRSAATQGRGGPLRDDVTSSPVKERTKGVSQRPSLPMRPEPPPRRREGAPRRIVPKGCRVSGSLGEGRTPAQAPPPRPDSAQLEAGPARGREVGKGPQEAGLRLGADLTPPAPSSPRGAALAPNPRHLSQLGQQRSLRTDPR